MAIVSVILDAAESTPALESVLAQTFSDFEIIKAARNTGLKEARGKYVYFMNADGMIFDNGLELLVNAAEKSGADIIHSTTYVRRDGENVEIVSADMYSSACVNLYRRDFLERTGLQFPDFGDDNAFCYAAACLAGQIVCIDEYFYVSNRHKDDSDEEKIYVRDINRDEIRCGFLVTSQRKKLWNAQIGLIKEFDRICKKYKLKWLAHSGTLLGAVRHGGFIPWDDDVDLGMLRPDFEKFKEVAPLELKSKFFLDLPENHAIEGEPNEGNFPVIPRELAEKIRAKGWTWPIVVDFFKLRDSSTSQIQWPERRNVNQGIWIDIFPFDPVPPFDDEQRYVEYEIKKLLLLTASFPDVVRKALDNNEQLPVSADILNNLLKLPFRRRVLTYIEYLKKTCFETPRVGRLKTQFLLHKFGFRDVSSFTNTIETPFEETTMTIPRDYEVIMPKLYGEDWRELIFKKSHVSSVTVDMSSEEFFKRVSPTIKEFNF